MRILSKIIKKAILSIIILLVNSAHILSHDNSNNLELNADYDITNDLNFSGSSFFKDADTWCNTQIMHNFSDYDNVYYLFPSQRFLDIERVKNLRFNGMYGPRKSDLYVHPQVIVGDLTGQYPQDAISLVIQCLFPSPDGVNFIANQAYSDPLSKISMSNLGLLLKDLINYKLEENKTEEVQKKLIIKIISYILNSQQEVAEKYDILNGKISDFLNYSFKYNLVFGCCNVAMNDSEALDDLSDRLNVDKEDIFDDLGWLYPESRTIPYFKEVWGDTQLQSGELEHYFKFSQVFPQIKRKQNSKEYGEYEKEMFYENNSQFFQAMVLAKALLKAFDFQQALDSHSFYPQHIVERSLMAFMWLKAFQIEDITEFYSSLFGIEANEEVRTAFLPHGNARESYETVKKELLDNSSLFQSEFINNSATLMLIGRGFEVYDSSFSPLLQYRSVPYQPTRKTKLKGTNFPDCVETSIRNFFNILVRTPRDNGFIYDGSLLKASKKVTEFYNKYQNALSVFSSDAFTAWGNLLTELPEVVYCKPTNTDKRLFEVRSGVLNALKIIAHLLNLPGLSETIDRARSNDEEALSESIDILTEYLSRKDYKLSIKDELEWDDKRKDYSGTLIFQVNGQDHFKWIQEKGHAYIKYISTQQDDWRKNLGVRPRDFHHSTAFSLSPWFTDAKDWVFVKELPVEKQLAFFWSLDLDNVESKLNLIRLNIADPDLRLREFANRLVSSFDNLDDHHATTQLAQLVYDMSTENVLLKDDIIRIVSCLPHIMEMNIRGTSNVSSDTFSYPFILWAYEISGGEALRAVYDRIEDFHLNLYELPEGKLEVAHKVLQEVKKLVNLEGFYVSGLPEQDSVGRKILVEAMLHLSEKIEFIDVSCNNLSYEDLLTILKTAPTEFLENFDISFNGVVYTTEKVYELCSTFLTRFEKASLRMILENDQGDKFDGWKGDLEELRNSLQSQGFDIDRLILLQ